MKVSYIAKNGEFTVDYSGNNGAVLSSTTVIGRRNRQGHWSRRWTSLLSFMPGEQKQVPRSQLLAEARELRGLVEKDLDLIQVAYSFADQHSPRFSGAGGLRIHGKLYRIDSGMGTCQLIAMEVGEDGRGCYGDVTDIRTLDAIDTDNQGQIRIRKRKKPITLHIQLSRLSAFLTAQPDELITIMMDGGKVHLRDIIEAYKEGIEHDWGRKQLLAKGEEAKSELVRMLKDRKSKISKLVLAQMLADCFPSPEVTRAIDSVLAAETDSSTRQLYSDLLRRVSQD